MDFVVDHLSYFRNAVDDRLRALSPLSLILGAIFGTYIFNEVRNLHRDDIGIWKRVVRFFFRTVRSVPYVRGFIREKLADVKKGLDEGLTIFIPDRRYFRAIPANKQRADRILQLAQQYDNLEGPAYQEGRVSGAVFNREDDEAELNLYKDIFGMFAWSNPLWPKLFPGIRIMEEEVVRMCCDMMHGDEESCGTMSTGGTISILLAVMAHRNRHIAKGYMHIEMVIPASAHAAFFKAGELFRIRVRKIPVDPITCKVDLRKMEAEINSRTCMLVGSAPNFPYGTIDDIEAIGQLGIKYDVPVHVDACLGGFLLPFLEKDYKYDFRVPGVSSISADSHKYGLSPKGSSVVLYRNKALRHNQYYSNANWLGGIYTSSTMEGSRCGHNIALCWAAMQYHSAEEYKINAKKVQETTRSIRDGLAQIDGIQLFGDNDVCIVSWTTTNGIPLFRFHNFMEHRRWQLNGIQFPAGMHIMVTMNHTRPGIAEAFVNDCREAMEYLRSHSITEEEKTSEAAIYGLAQSLPDRSLVREFTNIYLDIVHSLPPDAI